MEEQENADYPDTQDTFFNNSQADPKSMAQNESQDFQLFMGDDSATYEKSSQDVSKNGDSKNVEDNPLDNDDLEMVEATPPPSPDAAALKRKTDSLDKANDDEKKIARSSVSADSFAIDREKVQQSAILAEDSAAFFDEPLDTCDVVDETQEVPAAEKSPAQEADDEGPKKEDKPQEEPSKIQENGKAEAAVVVPDSDEEESRGDSSPKSQEAVQDDCPKALQNGDDTKSEENHTSRMSIEVIYDYKVASQEKPMEVVELDETNEKAEKSKSDESTSEVNLGTSLEKKNGLDESEVIVDKEKEHKAIAVVTVSDSENDLSLNVTKSPLGPNRSNLVEKDICMMVNVRCLVALDEQNHETGPKEVVGVNCRVVGMKTLGRLSENSDVLSDTHLADVSGNSGTSRKDSCSSPSSVTSNVAPFPLQSRHSIMSSASSASTSSVSSAAALAAKAKKEDAHPFSLPQVPRLGKHAKKSSEQEDSAKFEASLPKDWKNLHKILDAFTATLAGADMNSCDFAQNSVDHVEDDSTLKNTLSSSTPEPDSQHTESTLASHLAVSWVEDTERKLFLGLYYSFSVNKICIQTFHTFLKKNLPPMKSLPNTSKLISLEIKSQIIAEHAKVDQERTRKKHEEEHSLAQAKGRVAFGRPRTRQGAELRRVQNDSGASDEEHDAPEERPRDPEPKQSGGPSPGQGVLRRVVRQELLPWPGGGQDQARKVQGQLCRWEEQVARGELHRAIDGHFEQRAIRVRDAPEQGLRVLWDHYGMHRSKGQDFVHRRAG